MPNVYTRTGDTGQTGLLGGSRVVKQSPQVEAYGTVDEANAAIGVAKAAMPEGNFKDHLQEIQHRLFVVGAELASDDVGRAALENLVVDTDVVALEHLIDECLAFTGPQREFVVPGRDPVSGALHLARTLVRRAERRILTLGETQEVRPILVKYINRLSDAIYAVARVQETRFDLRRIETIVRHVVQQTLSGSEVDRPVLGRFDLSVAKTMAEAAEDKATTVGVAIVFAAVDAGGSLILLHRMEDSLLGSLGLATDKAYTSASLRVPTHDLKTAASQDGALFGIQNSNGGRIVVFGGGEPIFVDGTLRGGIGVSGGTVEQDMIIVTHALNAASGG